MNSKGFTLIELTAIIVVLVAIFLVSFPSLLNIAKVDEEKKYDSMVQNLCLAGEAYIFENTELFEEAYVIDNEIKVTIQELINYGNVDSNIVNPKTKLLVNNDSLFYTVLSDKSLKCTYKSS